MLNKDTDEQIKSVDILQCIYYIVMIVLGIVNFLRSISA
nr:MAG TPA: zinc finger domain-containing protein [Caudoviricetes sp.]